MEDSLDWFMESMHIGPTDIFVDTDNKNCRICKVIIRNKYFRICNYNLMTKECGGKIGLILIASLETCGISRSILPLLLRKLSIFKILLTKICQVPSLISCLPLASTKRILQNVWTSERSKDVNNIWICAVWYSVANTLSRSRMKCGFAKVARSSKYISGLKTFILA